MALGTWHFGGNPGGFCIDMSDELAGWAKKAGNFLSVPSGTQRACPLVPTDIQHMAVERAPPPLVTSGCREVRDAASTSWLAIARSGCQPPCYPQHGTKEHLPCAQTPHGVPWLVFLSSKKTGAPSSLHTRTSARSLSHKRVMQGADISKKIDHSH